LGKRFIEQGSSSEPRSTKAALALAGGSTGKKTDPTKRGKRKTGWQRSHDASEEITHRKRKEGRVVCFNI